MRARLCALVSSLAYFLTEVFDAFVFFSDKFNKSLSYRRHWRFFLDEGIAPGERLWIHGASVGELEDMAAFFLSADLLKKAGLRPDQVIVTSSSISAQERLVLWKKQMGFAYCGAIPPEKSAACQEFLSRLEPKLLLLSHSDIWPRLLWEASRAQVEVFWFPAKLPPPGQRLSLIKRYCLLPILSFVGLRQEADHVGLDMKLDQAFVGNPRVDRICQRIQAAKQRGHVLEDEIPPSQGRFRILMGSAWKQDAQCLAQALEKLSPEQRARFQVVCIPHEVGNASELAQIRAVLPDAELITREGILLEAYQDFDLAFVGGGFATGLHSVIEALLWSVPVVCGPDLSKQPEAHGLKLGGSLVALDGGSEQLASLLSQPEENLAKLKQKARLAAEKLQAHQGASDRIASWVCHKLASSKLELPRRLD